MLVLGSLMVAGSATIGVLLGWQNRSTPVHVHVGGLEWTAALSTVLIAGALLACWFLLGVAFVSCRIAERRRRRYDHRRHVRPASAEHARTRPSPREQSLV